MTFYFSILCGYPCYKLTKKFGFHLCSCLFITLIGVASHESRMPWLRSVSARHGFRKVEPAPEPATEPDTETNVGLGSGVGSGSTL